MICKEIEKRVLASVEAEKDDCSLTPALEKHLETCKTCNALLTLDQAMEAGIKNCLKPVDLPDGLETQVDISINHVQDIQKSKPKSVNIAIAVAAILVMLLSVVFYLNKPFKYKDLQQLGEHAVARHLEDNSEMTFSADEIVNATTMMSKTLKFNVILPDLSHKGYLLLGGRICTLGKCKIAYLYYQYQNKNCSLFILDYDHLSFNMADGSRFNNNIKGFETDIWKDNGQVYALVF